MNESIEQVMETYENEKRKQFEAIKNETLHDLERAENRDGQINAATVYATHEDLLERFSDYLASYYSFDVVPTGGDAP